MPLSNLLIACLFFSFIQCEWEELLIINEDVQHIFQGNEIIFFEIIDVATTVEGKKNPKNGK